MSPTPLPKRITLIQLCFLGFAADFEHTLTACCKSSLSTAELFSLATVLPSSVFLGT